MAKDLFHDTVKRALQKEGWRITHDPYPLRYGVVSRYAPIQNSKFKIQKIIIYNSSQEVIEQWIE